MWILLGAALRLDARSGETPAIPSRAGEPGYRIEGQHLTVVYPIVEEGQRLGTMLVEAHYGLREIIFPEKYRVDPRHNVVVTYSSDQHLSRCLGSLSRDGAPPAEILLSTKLAVP